MNFKRMIQEFIIINIGLFVCSLGIVNFLIPSKLAAGGVTGMATLIHYILDLPVGAIMLALNIPIFLLGFWVYGREYAVKCLCGIFLYPTYAGISEKFFAFDTLISSSEASPLTGAVLSGIVVGIGIGITVSVGSNTGGTVILAQVVNKYFKIPVGSCMVIVDSIVVISSVFIFGINSAVMALLSLIIMGKVINVVSRLETVLTPSKEKALA